MNTININPKCSRAMLLRVWFRLSSLFVQHKATLTEDSISIRNDKIPLGDSSALRAPEVSLSYENMPLLFYHDIKQTWGGCRGRTDRKGTAWRRLRIWTKWGTGGVEKKVICCLWKDEATHVLVKCNKTITWRINLIVKKWSVIMRNKRKGNYQTVYTMATWNIHANFI